MDSWRVENPSSPIEDDFDIQIQPDFDIQRDLEMWTPVMQAYIEEFWRNFMETEHDENIHMMLGNLPPPTQHDHEELWKRFIRADYFAEARTYVELWTGAQLAIHPRIATTTIAFVARWEGCVPRTTSMTIMPCCRCEHNILDCPIVSTILLKYLAQLHLIV